MGDRGRVSVILPYGGDDPYREAALDWVRPRWRALGYQVVLGEHEGQWCKARAVSDGLRAATGDVLVIADADVWCDGTTAAVEAVRSGAAWAMPHGPVRRLTHAASADVLAGADPHSGMDLVQRPYAGWPGGGIVVIPRRLYAEVPFDARFVGWSGEDESAAHAWTTLAGPPWRGTAPLWHLWHPPQERTSRRWGSPAARDLAGRYRAASRSPERMRALISETHVHA